MVCGAVCGGRLGQPSQGTKRERERRRGEGERERDQEESCSGVFVLDL